MASALNPPKIEAMSKIKRPESKRDIQVFLGMVGYYCWFIPGFATKREPLFHLLKAGVDFVCLKQFQNAFEKLETALPIDPVLKYPDFDQPFVVHKDASLTPMR